MARPKGKVDEQVEVAEVKPEASVNLVLVPGGRVNEPNERIIKIKDESEVSALSLSGKLTGYNPKTLEARIKID
jgi:hypothetical protein